MGLGCRTWEIEANGLRARDAGKWGVRRCATIGKDRVVREDSDAAASGVIHHSHTLAQPLSALRQRPLF